MARRQFGCSKLDQKLIDRIERLTGRPAHPFLRRGVFFAHRDLEKLLDTYEKGEPFYLYTGRGPSSEALHLGHLIPFMFTKYLQDAFKVPLVIQLTDDEKALWRGIEVEEARRLARENAKDIIACGFDISRTFIFADFDYMGGEFYRNINRFQRCVTFSHARSTFGFADDANIGKIAFPAVQACPAFPTSFPHIFGERKDVSCLVPCAIDQDPYFRVTRDVAHKIAPRTHPLRGKPALIHSKFFPPLQGAMGKMSSSDDNSAIFLTDDDATIERKIMTHAFSGGRETAKLQRELGADLEVDVAFQWLKFFLEDDDELASIEAQYGSGSGDYWNTAAVKKRLVVELQGLVKDHQAKRNVLTDADVASWMAVRELAPAL